jgi:hypothetical protein
MEEVLFTGMDIPKQTRKFVENVNDSVCDNMTESEKMAYLGGIENTLSALQSLLEICGEPVINISNHDGIEEMTIDEIEEIFLR